MWRTVVTQPLDRTCILPQIGPVDTAAGEFWVGNAFLMPRTRSNLSAYEQNRLFLNLQGVDFLDASFASGADLDSDSRSTVVADFDRDGRPDLLVGSVGGGPLRLFLNQFPATHRVRVILVGDESNRSAIGARIVARCGKQQIVRDVFAANGCMGQAPPDLILGLGDAESIDVLSVRWPNGRSEVLEDIPADRTITITEGKSGYKATPLGR